MPPFGRSSGPDSGPTRFAQTLERFRQLQESLGRRRRTGFRELVASTDELLWKLEDLNLKHVPRASPELRLEIEETISKLPDECQEAVPESASIQELLDGIFEAQALLFRWRHPEYFPAGTEDDA